MNTATLTDKIERALHLHVDIERAWKAIGTPHGLSQWLSDSAEFEPVVGSKMTVS